MAKKKRKTKDKEEIGTENELMKLKIMAEYGGDFVGNDNIPPDVENQFLKQILSFHKKHNESKLVTVYEMIGKPEYDHVHDLSDKEVAKELKRLMKLMEKNNVSLNVLSNPPVREVYRFITEELFKQQIEEVRVKGWVNQFIYEEFYPNPDYEVRSVVSSCIQLIFDRDASFFEDFFSESMKNSLGLSMDIEELEEQIREFKERFYNIRLDHFDVVKSEIDKDTGKAHMTCRVFYKTQSDKGKRYKSETATVEINLVENKEMDGWWEVQQVVSEVL